MQRFATALILTFASASPAKAQLTNDQPADKVNLPSGYAATAAATDSATPDPSKEQTEEWLKRFFEGKQIEVTAERPDGHYSKLILTKNCRFFEGKLDIGYVLKSSLNGEGLTAVDGVVTLDPKKLSPLVKIKPIESLGWKSGTPSKFLQISATATDGVVFISSFDSEDKNKETSWDIFCDDAMTARLAKALSHWIRISGGKEDVF